MPTSSPTALLEVCRPGKTRCGAAICPKLLQAEAGAATARQGRAHDGDPFHPARGQAQGLSLGGSA